MFFVTLLLNQIVSWVRSQPGTQSLRAILYMDEVFGFFPPVSNPPSKKPMLTLLKQARAYGLGVVLATQNPVDLDYKGLSNMGTWFIGRLQTERDRDRLLDGISGSISGSTLSRGEWESLLAGLSPREFVMRNIHEEESLILHTRWVMSYLCGPLTSPQIRSLMEEKKQGDTRKPETDSPRSSITVKEDGENSQIAPQVSDKIPQVFFPDGKRGQVYYPHILGVAEIHVLSKRYRIDSEHEKALYTPLSQGIVEVDWDSAAELPFDSGLLGQEQPEGMLYGPVPDSAFSAASYTKWKRAFVQHLYTEFRITMYRSRPLRLVSQPGEEAASFRGRVAFTLREKKDEAVTKLNGRYAKKIRTIESRLEREQERLSRTEGRIREEHVSSAIDIGSAILGSLFGKRSSSRRLVRSVGRSATRTTRAAGRKSSAATSRQKIRDLQSRLGDLEAELRDELSEFGFDYEVEQSAVEEVPVGPRKSDISVKALALVWVPESDGG